MLSVGREGFDLLALLILKADKNINILLLKNGLELLHKLIKGIGVVDHLVIFDMVLVTLGYDSSCIFLISILLGMLSELGQTLFLVLFG